MKKNERLYKAFENMPDEYIESAFENKPFETADTNTKSDELTEICTVEVYQHKRNWKIIAAATAACLVIGTVSSVVYKNNKYGVPADNPEITDCTVTENAGQTDNSENLFVIPELQNTTIDEALKIFDDAGINTMVKMCYSDTIPESEVIKTEPSAGTAIDKKSTVTIWGSRGTMRIMARMPDISSKSISDAEKILTGIDMLPEIVEVYDSDLPEGTVISFDPEPGTFVETGTTIVLNVSTKNSTRTKTEYEVTEISDNDFGAEEEPETCNLLIRDNDGNQRWIRVFDSYVNKNSIDVGSKIEFYY